MRQLWQSGGGFIKDVLEQLPEPRPPYTTLASTVRSLERKGYLRSEKLGNTFRFTPLVAAEEYGQHSLRMFVGSYFRNSYKDLVSFFAQQQHISAADLQDILDTIENQNQPPKP